MAETCGPKYKRLLEAFTDGDPEAIKMFARGFVVGQAEKVHIGACRAAMFRPSAKWRDVVFAAAEIAAEVYGLRVRTLEMPGEHAERWLIQADDATDAMFDRLTCALTNSPSWHCLRGRLCGVPETDLDAMFHEREGYNESADDITESTSDK